MHIGWECAFSGTAIKKKNQEAQIYFPDFLFYFESNLSSCLLIDACPCCTTGRCAALVGICRLIQQAARRHTWRLCLAVVQRQSTQLARSSAALCLWRVGVTGRGCGELSGRSISRVTTKYKISLESCRAFSSIYDGGISSREDDRRAPRILYYVGRSGGGGNGGGLPDTPREQRGPLRPAQKMEKIVENPAD